MRDSKTNRKTSVRPSAARRRLGGFTLVELLIAMSVFIIITVVAVGAFIQSLKSERHIVTMIAVDNDLNSALEQMAREMRSGYLFTTSSQAVGVDALHFINFSGASTTYGVVSGTLARDGQAITSNNVVIKRLSFIVSQPGNPNAVSDTCYPWRVTILMGIGAAGASPAIPPTYIQTTVSSRIFPKDVPPIFKYSSPAISGC